MWLCAKEPCLFEASVVNLISLWVIILLLYYSYTNHLISISLWNYLRNIVSLFVH